MNIKRITVGAALTAGVLTVSFAMPAHAVCVVSPNCDCDPALTSVNVSADVSVDVDQLDANGDFCALGAGVEVP